MTKLTTATLHFEQSLDIENLIAESKSLNYKDRIRHLFANFRAEDILITSSFGVKSVLLLSLLSEVRKDHPVYFVNTGYHFKETLAYKNSLIQTLDLNVVELHPEETQHQLTEKENWWIDHPKMCCTINKIAPLQSVIEKHKVWVSNLMAFETEFRSRLELYQKQGAILKFHPFLDLNEEEYKAWLRQLKVKKHPLFGEGYDSIGCTHCTSKGTGRAGRWLGVQKTECGLHEKYFLQKKSES